MSGFSDGYTDRIEELLKQLTAERAKVHELEAHNAVLREELKWSRKELEKHAVPIEIYDYEDGQRELDCVLKNDAWKQCENIDKSLSLTPSEDAEMERKKDDALKRAIDYIVRAKNLVNHPYRHE